MDSNCGLYACAHAMQVCARKGGRPWLAACLATVAPLSAPAAASPPPGCVASTDSLAAPATQLAANPACETPSPHVFVPLAMETVTHDHTILERRRVLCSCSGRALTAAVPAAPVPGRAMEPHTQVTHCPPDVCKRAAARAKQDLRGIQHEPAGLLASPASPDKLPSATNQSLPLTHPPPGPPGQQQACTCCCLLLHHGPAAAAASTCCCSLHTPSGLCCCWLLEVRQITPTQNLQPSAWLPTWPMNAWHPKPPPCSNPTTRIVCCCWLLEPPVACHLADMWPVLQTSPWWRQASKLRHHQPGPSTCCRTQSPLTQRPRHTLGATGA